MTTQIELPYWYDLHAHFRQGALLAPLIAAHKAMGCAGIVAMPNTKPPVGKVFRDDPLPCLSIEEYHGALCAAGGDSFSAVIVPLYLTADTTPAMIAAGAKSGLLRACKYYPPHGTTGAEFAAALDFFRGNGVFREMEICRIPLCLHGEEHGMAPERYFARNGNAEDLFYKERAPRLAMEYPDLRIVAEHVTTQTAVKFVKQAGNAAATVTPQHLLYTVGHLLQGIKYHLYCLPLLKFEEDRQALREAVTDPANTKFFAGTDSAPHTKKATACGCAAGCFTGGVAPQLYAQAFAEAGADPLTKRGFEAFQRFLCLNGPAFYKLPAAQGRFTLAKREQFVSRLMTAEGEVVPLPLGALGDPAAETAVLPWAII